MKLVLLLSFISFGAFAQDIQLKDYDWTVMDVRSRGLTKENLYSRMDRKFVKTKSSICSNRALMWAEQFKRNYNLDTAKIFLFYTEKKSELSLRTWWYHVSPVVNEDGKLWVMDAGFPGFISNPLTKEEWLNKFSHSYNCKEINASETDLIEYIFNGSVFPNRTAYGHYDCYYKIVPHTIWTPEVLATNLLGRDSSGRPVRIERPEIDREELYQACVEASTSKIEYALGANREKCKNYAGIN